MSLWNAGGSLQMLALCPLPVAPMIVNGSYHDPIAVERTGVAQVILQDPVNGAFRYCSKAWAAE